MCIHVYIYTHEYNALHFKNSTEHRTVKDESDPIVVLIKT